MSVEEEKTAAEVAPADATLTSTAVETPAVEAPAAASTPASPFPAPPPMAEIAGVEAVERAAEILRRGGLVAMPTETVYGLGADATNDEALRRLYHVKRRPVAHPVIVHLASAEDLPLWAAHVSPAAQSLAQRFWPGPLTLVVRRAAHVSNLITGGAETVALRVPRHPVAEALLQALRAPAGADVSADTPEAGAKPVGIAAPSANRFGKVSPTSARHVQTDLGLDVDLILEGGACEVGIESTIVDVSGEAPAILRPGAISAAQIEAALHAPLEAPAADAAVVPGSLPAHYAPRAKARLAKRVQIIEALATNRGRRIAVLALEVAVSRVGASLAIVEPAVPGSYAKALYANLRALDAAGADLILIETPPDLPSWAAVMDRLRRATHGADAEPKRRTRRSREEAVVEPSGESVDESPNEPAAESVSAAAGEA